MTEIKSICVFCGASIGARTEYSQAAHDLGKELAHHDITLVYGGGSVGLMGLIADTTLKHGGKAIGIMPEALTSREIDHEGLTEFYVVKSMHERKALMAEKADAFVALPGGFGTYEELFEIITWAQLGIHSKPIVIVNIAGYYDPLLQLMNHGVQEGFIRNIDPTLVRVTDRVKGVLPTLKEAPDATFRPKWMTLAES